MCLTKQDEVAAHSGGLPFPVDFALSAKTGEGVDEWLAEILNTKRVVGAQLLEVDYKRYAEAEAALGWVNLHAQIRLSEPASPSLVCGPLFDMLAASLAARGRNRRASQVVRSMRQRMDKGQPFREWPKSGAGG